MAISVVQNYNVVSYSSGQGAYNIARPSLLAQGDIMVVIVQNGSNSGNNITSAGFTRVATQSNVMQIFYKKITGLISNEPLNYTFQLQGGNGIAVAVIRGVNLSVKASGEKNYNTTLNLGAQTNQVIAITTLGNGSLGSGYTFINSHGSGSNYGGQYQIYNTSAAPVLPAGQGTWHNTTGQWHPYLLIEETPKTFSDSYGFKTGGATGRTGPTQAQLDNAYNGTALSGKVTSVSGKQEWIVPKTGTYTIDVSGAQGGGSSGGRGARMEGDFNLVAGEKLTIVVGQMGTVGSNSNGGGGGASFVMKGTTPLVVAGGGGGFLNYGTTTKPGLGGEITTQSSIVGDGSKGIGNGGKVGSGTGGAGGGGLNTAGDGNTYATAGQSLLGNALGGTGYTGTDYGGFGGGGAAGYSGGGGAGGYTGASGGGSAAVYAAGGGGSYNGGASQSNIGGTNTGEGKVVISLQGLPNNVPTQPTSFSAQPSLNSVNLSGDSLSVSWGDSTDADGDTIKYTLEFYNGSSWGVIASGLTSTSYTYILPSLNITNAQFRVKAVDSKSGESIYRTSNVFTIRKYLLLIQDGEEIKTFKNSAWQTI